MGMKNILEAFSINKQINYIKENLTGIILDNKNTF